MTPTGASAVYAASAASLYIGCSVMYCDCSMIWHETGLLYMARCGEADLFFQPPGQRDPLHIYINHRVGSASRTLRSQLISQVRHSMPLRHHSHSPLHLHPMQSLGSAIHFANS